MRHRIEHDQEPRRQLQREDRPFARRQLDGVERDLLHDALIIGRQLDAGAPEDLPVVFERRELVGAVGRDLAQARAHREGDLDHMVERGLVARLAEDAAIFRLVERLEGRVGIEHAGATAADDVPGHLEEAEARRMQQCCDHALLGEPFLGRELDGVDLVQRLVGPVATSRSMTATASPPVDWRKAANKVSVSLMQQRLHECRCDEHPIHDGETSRFVEPVIGASVRQQRLSEL